MINPLSLISKAAIAPFAPYLIAAALAAAAGGLALGIHYEREIGRDEIRAEMKTMKAGYELAIQTQKTRAAADLAAETRHVLDLERQLGALRAAQEKTDADHAQIVSGLRADLRRKSRAAGGPGLRDPFAAAGCGSSGGGAQSAAVGSPDSGPADPAQAGGLLSVDLEQLLLRITSEADDINVAYASCRQDAMNIRAAAPP